MIVCTTAPPPLINIRAYDLSNVHWHVLSRGWGLWQPCMRSWFWSASCDRPVTAGRAWIAYACPWPSVVEYQGSVRAQWRELQPPQKASLAEFSFNTKRKYLVQLGTENGWDKAKKNIDLLEWAVLLYVRTIKPVFVLSNYLDKYGGRTPTYLCSPSPPTAHAWLLEHQIFTALESS